MIRDFIVSFAGDDGLVVSAAKCDVVMRVVEGRLVVKVLAYDEERKPELELTPCWPTTATVIEP